MKRVFPILCLAMAAVMLYGCGMIVNAMKMVREGPEVPPGSNPAQTVRPTEPEPKPEPETEPASQPAQELIPRTPKQAVFTGGTPMQENMSYTFHETTYTITTEFSDENGWPITRLLAEEENGWESAVTYDHESFVAAYYVETRNGPCIFLTTEFDKEPLKTTFILNASSLAEADAMGGIVYSIDGDVITILFEVNMLGTYPAIRDYIVGGDLTMQPVGDGLFYITKDKYYIPDDYYLVSAKNLQVQMYENGQYRDETLPAGTQLRVTATDGDSIVYFRTRDDREGIFPVVVERDYFKILIHGVPAEECFEELPYSG
ncbi:MAG: hypothetical protein BWY11_02509 [Firmicutes bacterium ADurb.Bin182]|nr:MAG: hypothetical protein BWY11_02509 [Firmicutes bacterium ADurb.Bin182]